jgi:O-antigen ligase
MRDGHVAFVLYREPKLAISQILGWALLAALAWMQPGGLRAMDVVARLRRLPWALLALFTGWGLITALWVEVPQNLFYELEQYALLLPLALALEAWADRDPTVPQSVELGLVASLGLCVAVGILQAIVPLAILSPIDPGFAAINSSFFGYKNPMALAVAGQIFLLVRLCARLRPGRRVPLMLLIATELIYILALKSRTVWAALAGAILFLALLVLVREGFSRRLARAAVVLAAVAILCGTMVTAVPDLRWRAASLTGYLTHPSTFLESDRGTYLINTLQMARFHPLGVGLGDWQTQYPLYRKARRDLFVSDTTQIRKAHSDPVQYLGETGWPGLALWLGFVLSLLVSPVRRFLRTGDLQAGLAAGQVMVFALAMLADSLVEHPYGKMQMILIAFLAVRAGDGEARRAEPRLEHPRRWSLAAVGLTLVAACAVVISIRLIDKSFRAAVATDLVLEAQERMQSRTGPPRLEPQERALLERAVRAGEGLDRGPGISKELGRDLLAVARAELLLGHLDRAAFFTRAALHLQPYNPEALGLMATALQNRPVRAAWWRSAHDYVLNEATHGFARRHRR